MTGEGSYVRILQALQTDNTGHWNKGAVIQGFDWDEAKARTNLKKHGISFEEATTVFLDPLLLTFSDSERSDSEQRYISIGISSSGRLLRVAHTDREDKIRLIRCLSANAMQRRLYET